jgi:hypothetical protein
VQKTETFTGIDGINVQDRATQESMGLICDRSQEHLGPADKGIIQMRRLLREAINTVRAGGTPAGVAPSYYDLYLCTAGIAARHPLASNPRPQHRSGENPADGVGYKGATPVLCVGGEPRIARHLVLSN